MTGQTLLDYMVVLNRELKTASAERDVTRALVALNIAQDYFETLAGQTQRFGTTIGTVTMTADQETTTLPTNLLRLEKLQFIDPDTSRPKADISPLFEAGSHAPSDPWEIFSDLSTGEPRWYWMDSASFYWRQIPDSTHTARWTGFARASDISAAGTFAYDDGVALPVATFATRLMKLGLDDPLDDHTMLAQESFGPILKTLSRIQRTRAAPPQYRYVHDT